jgi:hypothetical protein
MTIRNNNKKLDREMQRILIKCKRLMEDVCRRPSGSEKIMSIIYDLRPRSWTTYAA